jgi:hypothetical protein
MFPAACLHDFNSCKTFLDEYGLANPGYKLDLSQVIYQPKNPRSLEPSICSIDKFYFLHPSFDVENLSVIADGRQQVEYPTSDSQIDLFEKICNLLESNQYHVPSNISNILLAEYIPSTRDSIESYPWSVKEILESASTTEETVSVNYFQLRHLTEKFKIGLAIKHLISDMSDDIISHLLPPINYIDTVYGRHWDVLSHIIDHNNCSTFIEIGVAIGGLAKFISTRYPDIQYIGIDPNIKQETVDWIIGNTTNHSNRSIIPSKSQDAYETVTKHIDASDHPVLIFIDGPHTYEQVKLDISMYSNIPSNHLIICGHDFTPAHPPLLYAVLEQAINRQVSAINLFMDGVWCFSY